MVKSLYAQFSGVAIAVLASGIDCDRAGIMEGRVAYESEQYQLAVREFSDVVESRPSYAYGQLMLGLSLEGLGQASWAEYHLAEAVRLQPDYVEALYALAYFNWKRERYREAAVFATQAMEEAGPQRADL